ncbi:MAG: transglycosylase domain-containing protein [Gaiellaceae bacterium]
MRLRRRSVAPRSRRRRIRKLRLLALIGVLLTLASASFVYGVIIAVAGQTWQLESVRQQERERNGYVYDRTGKRILAVLRGSQNRVIVGSDEIAPIMKQAIVAVEDRRFWQHEGVDFRAIGRAFWADVRKQDFVQGGSTITQQFVKNVFVENERSLGRKLKEAILARQLEQKWSKDRILSEYLNTIYFGNGAYGVEQASRVYFKHSARRLRLHEAALLAAIPSDPSRYDPVTNPRAARRHRDDVLGLMLAQGLILPPAYRYATRRSLPPPRSIRLPDTQGPAGYFVNYVKQQLIDKYGTSRVFGGGFRVRTTIDLGLQQTAHGAIAKWLTDPDGPTAALVAIDPRNGDVLAMVGGSNFRQSEFNLAVQGERQPGSSFKPFVLAAALDQGIAPSTTFASHELDIPSDGRVWHVENYEGSYLGRADLETATVYSDNSVYAQLTRLVGPATVARMAHRLGIKSDLNAYLSIGLGAEAVNPLEMARAFASFASGGNRVDGAAFGNRPHAIQWVGVPKGRDPNPVEPLRRNLKIVADNHPVAKPVLDPVKTAVLTDILQGVVQRGTASRALEGFDFPAAGKTGTTENHGDAWFVGYTPRLAVAVWVGYPNQLRPMLTEYNGDPVAGGTFPTLIWRTFMLKALKHLHAEPEEFPPSPGLYASPRYVVMRDGRLQLDNGVCRDAFQVAVFSEGGPSQVANCRENEVQVPDLVGVRLAEARAILAAQPLEPLVVYRRAAPRQRIGVVLDQIPKPSKRLSSGDLVTIILGKPLDGVVPRLVGLPLDRALARLERVNLVPRVSPQDADSSHRVLSQWPRPGVAAAPGLPVKLVVRAD